MSLRDLQRKARLKTAEERDALLDGWSGGSRPGGGSDGQGHDLRGVCPGSTEAVGASAGAELFGGGDGEEKGKAGA